MNWGWILAFGAGCATALTVSAWYRRALASAARRQREADQQELAQMQHRLRRMTSRCAASEEAIGKQRLQTAWQAGIIQGTAMANRRGLRVSSWVD